jgi:hypothetical protein
LLWEQDKEDLNVFFNNAYYWVYGDRKYSEVVLDRWTPATAETASYPRLSSVANQNNFRNSTYWLYDNNQFTLHTLQVTYTFMSKNNNSLEQLRLFLRGGNLVTLSDIKDKLNLNVGSAPQSRSVSIGLTATF